MSVTFTAATRTFNSAFNAVVLRDVPAAEHLAVNMSNTNAAVVCGSLGINLDAAGWCGSLTASDFLGRILVALAVNPADAGIPAHELPVGDAARPAWAGEARFIECGRREGYTEERLGQLRELADWAVAHGAEISFG